MGPAATSPGAGPAGAAGRRGPRGPRAGGIGPGAAACSCPAARGSPSGGPGAVGRAPPARPRRTAARAGPSDPFSVRGWDPVDDGERLPTDVFREAMPGTAADFGPGFAPTAEGPPAGRTLAADPLRPGRERTRLDWYNEGLDVAASEDVEETKLRALLPPPGAAPGAPRSVAELSAGAKVRKRERIDALPAHLRAVDWRYPRLDLLYPTFRRNTLNYVQHYESICYDRIEADEYGLPNERAAPPSALSIVSYFLMAAWFRYVPFPVSWLVDKLALLPLRLVLQPLHKQCVLLLARMDAASARYTRRPELSSLRRALESYHCSISFRRRLARFGATVALVAEEAVARARARREGGAGPGPAGAGRALEKE